jgi:hypothetical protein
MVCELVQIALFIDQPGVGGRREWEVWGGLSLSMLIRLIDAFLITNNRKLGSFKKLIQFGTELQLENQVKYLRVTLDEKFNYNSHIDWQCQRAIRKPGD